MSVNRRAICRRLQSAAAIVLLATVCWRPDHAAAQQESRLSAGFRFTAGFRFAAGLRFTAGFRFAAGFRFTAGVRYRFCHEPHAKLSQFCDSICCRHAREHIIRLRALMRSL